MILRCLFFLALLWVGVPVHAFPEFYGYSQQTEAKKEAGERKLPLAWLGGRPTDLTDASPLSISTAEFERMAIATLKDRAVIVFFDGVSETALPAVVNAELHVKDDGVLPDGHTWRSPKVVFTNAEASEAIGRVSRSQMDQNGEGAINSALQIMRNKERSAQAQETPSAPTIIPSAPVKSGKEGEVVGGFSKAVDFIDLVAEYRLPIVAIGIAVAAAFAWFIALTRKK